MEDIHTRYDPVLGAAIVEVLERLQVFNIFRSVWFSAGLTLLVISIVVCTLDRTPQAVARVADIRVVQPEPYFDPRCPDRAAMTGVGRRGRADRPPRAPFPGPRGGCGRRHDLPVRRPPPLTKMATLLTHTGWCCSWSPRP